MTRGIDVFDQHGYDAAHVAEDVEIQGERTMALPERAKHLLTQVLWATSSVFGLAAWVVDLAAVNPPGYAVPLAVLAGAVAAIGLLPGQKVRGWLAVAVAFTAFTAGVTTTVTSGGADGVLVAIDVLVALQVVVAVSALLLAPRESAVTHSDDDYESYARYVQAYQDYVQQYGSHWPAQYCTAGMAQAEGHGQATAAGTSHGDQDAWADMQAKYAHNLSPMAPAPSSRRDRRAEGGDFGGEDSGDAGLPGVNRADQPYFAPGQAAPGSAPTSLGAY
jgi:hypothetical protein